MHCTQGQMTKIELIAGNYWSIHVSEVTNKKEFCLQEQSHKNCSTCQKKITRWIMIRTAFPKEKQGT